MAGLTASLAACQKDANAPARVSIAVHVVCELARLVAAAQARKHPGQERAAFGGVSPDNVFLAYDGTVELLDAARTQPAYLAPEQITSGEVDRRADVFSLGIILWELLTATTLFVRPTASETRIAVVDDPIHDVRDVNPEVPALVADVLGTALSRDRAARFDSVEAFSKALAGARASSGTADASKQDIAQWVAERVPPPSRAGAPRPGGPISSGRGPTAPPASAPAPAAPAPAAPAPAAPAPAAPAPAALALAAAVPDLDIPSASRAHRSVPNMPAVQAPASKPAGMPASIPAFDVNALAAAALAPPSRSSGSGAAGGGREIAFDPGEDDDLEMEIERNVASTSLPTATSSRASGTHAAARPSGAHRVSGAGLDLAQPSRIVREGAAARVRAPEEPAVARKLAAALVSLAVAGGSAFALFRQLHRAGGRSVTRILPHAFDGTSATESGAVSLVVLVVAAILVFVGLRMKPHAWTIIASGGALLLLALAMVTVTLASTGENPTPPDGVLLVPYLFPAALMLLALGVHARASRMFARSRGARRFGSIPLAAIAGALAFVAFEASRLAR